MDQRFEQLKVWLKQLGITYQAIEPASADASFRRYFRITSIDNDSNIQKTQIVMDAPPEKEDCKPFIKIANMLFDIGLNVPQVLQQDLQQGFLLLSDLGNTVYLSELNNHSVDSLYEAAIQSLLLMQQKGKTDLPPYDEVLLRNELALFPDWYLAKQLNITLTDKQKTTLDMTFDILVKNALVQPKVFVHRDYHSRNLMINNQQGDNFEDKADDKPEVNPGILDFQDAVLGPVT